MIVNQKGYIAVNWIEVYSLTKIPVIQIQNCPTTPSPPDKRGCVNKGKPKQKDMAVLMDLD